MEPHPTLSQDAAKVLTLIADGRSYEQILVALPHLTYHDIFDAAAKALALTPAGAARTYSVAEKRERYPRAYEIWTDDEDSELSNLVHEGSTVARIATHLGRNRGAIRSRIIKLGLVDALAPKEQHRLRRAGPAAPPPAR